MINFVETIKPSKNLIHDLVRIAIKKPYKVYVDDPSCISAEDMKEFQRLPSGERLKYLRNIFISYIVIYDDSTNPNMQYLKDIISLDVIETNIDIGIMQPVVIGTTNYAILYLAMFNSGLEISDDIKKWIHDLPYAELICPLKPKRCSLCGCSSQEHKFYTNVKVTIDTQGEIQTVPMCAECISKLRRPSYGWLKEDQNETED